MSERQVEELGGDAVGVRGDGTIGVRVHAFGPVGETEERDINNVPAVVLGSSVRSVEVSEVAPPAGVIEAAVAPGLLRNLELLPWITAVTPLTPVHLNSGVIKSEGVQLHGADKAALAGLDGEGATVGVISDGVRNLADAQRNGRLPQSVTVLDPGPPVKDANEGTAMLEVVHDMAPKAQLVFASVHGPGGLDGAMRKLAQHGVNIITHDIAIDVAPAFQRGQEAATADELAAKGILLVTSVGNLGDRHAPRRSAIGTGHTSAPAGPPNAFAKCKSGTFDNLVDLTGHGDTTFTVELPPQKTSTINLQWSEPRAIFPTVGQGGFTNLDLLLLNVSGTDCLGQSTGVQMNGRGDTQEKIVYRNTQNFPVRAKIAVNVTGATTKIVPTYDLRWRGAVSKDVPDPVGSLDPNANFTGKATSVGAVNASASTSPTDIPIEPFSAAGPVRILTTTQCAKGAAGPCTGVAGPGGVSYAAPTWSAADGVSISGAGGFGSGKCPTLKQGDCRFFGTSAAAPSAAGVAALIRNALNRNGVMMSPDALPAAMRAAAEARGTPGLSNPYGYGVLQVRPSLFPPGVNRSPKLS
ncbi:S8 family serine peptidase [Amycolatopsis sp. cmx-11-12]|uniref:S8 family serine peptidase n=1 Tax=Amycolatopsis sp. cmx-11-12 TaxID=2785795 RepID=UPI003918450B